MAERMEAVTAVDAANPEEKPVSASTVCNFFDCLAVTPKEAHVYRFTRNGVLEEYTKTYNQIHLACWSPNGENLAIVQLQASNTVQLIDCETWSSHKTFTGESAVLKFYFSPQSRYLVVLYASDPSTKVYPIICWNVESTEKQFTASVKSVNPPYWPIVQWSQMETICCRLVPNELLLFHGALTDLRNPIKRLGCERAQHFRLAPEVEVGRMNVAIMAPSSKDLGKLYAYKVLDMGWASSDSKLLLTEAFGDAEEMEVFWSFNGEAALLKIHTSVDRTGRSYYGVDTLHFVSATGLYIKSVLPPAKGPLQDVQWNPTRQEFILCSGPMPPEIVLYDGRNCTPKISFGTARMNTIRWNPFGRFFAVGGFGNLAGGLGIWDKVTRKSIGSTQAPCTVTCEFGPDGRHILAATTSPRLRVDNCLKVYRYTGELVSKLDFTELLYATWKPVKSGVFEDRGKSPNSIQPVVDGAVPPLPSLNNTHPSVEAGRRGALALRLREERAAGNTMKAIRIASSNEPQNVDKDTAEPHKRLSRTERRKEKERRETQKEALESADTVKTPPVQVDASQTGLSPTTEEDPLQRVQKDLRNLRKKLKAIERLQAKEALTPEEKKRVQSVPTLELEIADLEGRLNALEIHKDSRLAANACSL